MKHIQFSLLLSLVSVAVSAQVVSVPDAVAAQPTREQRRAELRTALKTPPSPELTDKNQATKADPANRHLSAQERADLREQLRQQRDLSKP